LQLAWIVVVAALTAVLCGCSRTPPSLAITNVTVIDATGSDPKLNSTVVVVDGRIRAVGSTDSTAIPRGAQVVNGAGKFLIPGLADFHLHLTGASEPTGSRELFLPLLLANGITSVRDMGGYLDALLPLREEIRKGKRLGPDIVFAGPYLDGQPPSFQPSLVVTNAAQGADGVDSLVAEGVDFIKVQSILDRAAYFSIAQEAKRQHISFVGHVPDRVTAAEASDAGQRSIEHLTGVLRACSSDEPKLMREQFAPGPKNQTPAGSHEREIAWEKELLASYSEKTCAELISKFAANQTWQTPTLVLLRQDAYPTPESDASVEVLFEFMPRTIVEKWKQVRRKQDQFAAPADFKTRDELLARSMLVTALMQKSGVHILAGTDSAAPNLVPGFALHQELALLVGAGLSPMQALQAATKSPAEFIGAKENQGSIEVGKDADLVLLDANPLEDIRNTEKIRALILRGKLLDRAALDGLLSSVRKFAAAN
jgi:imidazolonepropionase-like amidohydrolase